jgi:hypothetical protein
MPFHAHSSPWRSGGPRVSIVVPAMPHAEHMDSGIRDKLSWSEVSRDFMPRFSSVAQVAEETRQVRPESDSHGGPSPFLCSRPLPISKAQLPPRSGLTRDHPLPSVALFAVLGLGCFLVSCGLDGHVVPSHAW